LMSTPTSARANSPPVRAIIAPYGRSRNVPIAAINEDRGTLWDQ